MSPPRRLSRRDFLSSGLVALGVGLAGPSIWRAALADPARPGSGPYGPLGPADANGIRLPEGFTSRFVARSGETVPGTPYVWHDYPDGGAVFGTDDGGWIYVSNSETGAGAGVGAVRFAPGGEVVDAYRILDGTSRNCAGGPTPWGTWLSCEEHGRGRVWECDPAGVEEAVPLPAMGRFTHEAAAVDPVHGHVYLTEDEPDGRLYRFVPEAYPDLGAGGLEVARVENLEAVTAGDASLVRWEPVPDPSGASQPTRYQVSGSTRFRGGEGTWYADGVVYFTTKGDGRVWAYDTAASRLELLYDQRLADPPVLTGVDNVFASERSGEVYVAEDGGDLDIVVITPDRVVARLLKVTGPAHDGSELAGPALDPSHTRLYFSSQRGFGRGATYEITGPFRTERGAAPPEPAPVATARPTAAPTPRTTPRPTPTAPPTPRSTSAPTATPRRPGVEAAEVGPPARRATGGRFGALVGAVAAAVAATAAAAAGRLSGRGSSGE